MTREKALTPYGWQAADIAKCVGAMRSGVGALICSAPGAGKTLVATEIAKALGAKVILIVAPQGTHRSAWLRTVRRQELADDVRVLLGDAKGKAALADLQWGVPGVYITTQQWFARQDWSKIKPDMLIYDEIHQAGTYGIKTSKALLQLTDVQYRLGLSGTPLRNNFENAWAIVSWIEPAKMPYDFWVFRLAMCATKPHPFKPQGREVTGELNPGALFNSLTCYVQHLQRERCCDFHPNGFLAHLPEPVRIERIVDMQADQAKFYREMENKLASSLLDEDGAVVRVHAEQFIVARNMLRRAACALPWVETVEGTNAEGETVDRYRLHFDEDTASPKIDTLVSDLPSHEGRHTLVLTHSRQIADLAVARIAQAGYSVEAWHGKVTKKKRDAILDAFTSGQLEVIVGVISAMGTGTDGLQEVCYNLDWLSYDDDATNNRQGLGRTDRLGQDTQVVQRIYMSDRTIDVGFYGKQMERVLKIEESLKKVTK